MKSASDAYHDGDGVEEMKTDDARGALLSLLAGGVHACRDGRRSDFGNANGARICRQNCLGLQLSGELLEDRLLQGQVL